MSLTQESPLVCQIPGCTTTQSEIETELATFLAGYCSVCKKDREGKLCSCAFPCSLTFKSQMLTKIHELLGIEKPSERRAIQVCFKHPDLLKQAREACVAKREEKSKLKRRNSAAVSTEVIKPKSTKLAGDQPKMCKIQFQDESDTESDTEEFADIVPESSCSRSVPMMSSVQAAAQAATGSKSVNIKFRLGSISGSDNDSDADEGEDILENNEVTEHNEDELQRKLCEIFGPDEDSNSQNSSISSNSSNSNFQFTIQTDSLSPTRKVMKIQYQDYYNRILTSEMKSLMHQSYLNDVQFVCKDGNVSANCLIIGSMSNYLYNILAEVPIVDKVKIVIMPDVSSVDLNSFFKLLFNPEATKSVSVKDMRRIKSIAALFKLEPILVMTRKPGRPKGSLNKQKLMSPQTPNVSAQPGPRLGGTGGAAIAPPNLQQSPSTCQQLSGLVKRKIFPSLKRQETMEQNTTHSNINSVVSTLEIFASNQSNPTQNSQNSIVTSQNPETGPSEPGGQGGQFPPQILLMHHRAPTDEQNMNLLPTNDLLDQIVQDTS